MTPSNTSYRAYRFISNVKKRLGLGDGAAERWSERRTKHMVAFGETIEQIAKKRLGDERFANLIVTLDRGVLSIESDGTINVPPGTILELPAPVEVKVYRTNFAVGMRPRRSPTRTITGKAEATRQADKAMGDGSDDGNFAVALSEACRMFVATRGPFASQFSVKLQTVILGSYVTIAAYESILGKTKRLLYRCDGTCRQMDIELPASVAKEMAKRDFARNWQRYYDQYFVAVQTIAPPVQQQMPVNNFV